MNTPSSGIKGEWARASTAGPFAPHDLSRWTTIANGDEVLALRPDPQRPGTLWAGTEGGGVLVWNVTDGTYQQYLRPGTPGLASNIVHDIAFDADGAAWLATANGVSRAKPGGSWSAFGVSDGLPDSDVRAIAVTPDGRVWAGTRDAGLAVLDKGGVQWRTFKTAEYVYFSSQPREGPGARAVVAMVVDSAGNVWVAHGRSSDEQPALSLYVASTNDWRHISAVNPRGDPSRGPRTSSIMALTIDPRDGSLWVAGWGRGVARWNGTEWRTYIERHGLCGTTVLALTATADGVWAACGDERGGSGVARFDGVTWHSAVIPPDVGSAVPRALAISGEKLWLGTNGPKGRGVGIVQVGQQEGAARLRTSASGLPANHVTSLAFSDDGSLWVGTRGAGLARRTPAGQWTRYTRESTDGGLPGDTVVDLLASGNHLWVAATKSLYRDGAWRDGGVAGLDVQTEDWVIQLHPGQELPDGDVSSLAEDGAGRLWIGLGQATGGAGAAGTTHHGEGVVAFDIASSEVTIFRYGAAGGGPVGDTVTAVASTGKELWIGASHHQDLNDGRRVGGGVSSFDGRSWRSWRAGESGFLSLRGGGPAGGRDPWITGDVRSIMLGSDGYIWAGGIGGAPEDMLLRWPHVDAAINHWNGDRWHAHSFESQGWVAAMAEDSAARPWVGLSRGPTAAELPLLSRTQTDPVAGGVRIWIDETWLELTPNNSGLSSNAVTALEREPSTGDMWVGFENGGLSVYHAAPPTPTPTGTTAAESTPVPPGPTRPPTITPLPSATPTPTAVPLWLPLAYFNAVRPASATPLPVPKSHEP